MFIFFSIFTCLKAKYPFIFITVEEQCNRHLVMLQALWYPPITRFLSLLWLTFFKQWKFSRQKRMFLNSRLTVNIPLKKKKNQNMETQGQSLVAKKGCSFHETTHSPNVINMNRVKTCKSCTAWNTMAFLFTYVHLCLGITPLLTVKSCFYQLNFSDLLLVVQMSVIIVNRRWWKLSESFTIFNIKIL